MLRRLADWLFRNRQTGEITIVQVPNIPLGVFLVAAVASRLLADSSAATVLAVVSAIALVVWALDELIRGVNPWRRILGATVLVITVAGYVMRR
jgi:hypothetical protein